VAQDSEGNWKASGGQIKSIQEWAALAEIIGAVAVVASLIYLAIQVRQNTHELSMSLKSTELAAFERNVKSGIRDWLSHNNPDWRPQFAALVKQRVHLFEKTAEKASGAEQESSSKHTDE
jgi:hypothetical protein